MSFHRLFTLPTLGLTSCYITLNNFSFFTSNVKALKSSTYPTFSSEDVSKHNNLKDGIWISYGDGVYDITNLRGKHVGGPVYIDIIAGGPLEPFWSLYGDHMTCPDTLNLLESYRIGNLLSKDKYNMSQHNGNNVWSYHPFKNDPKRDENMSVMRNYPFLGEVDNHLLSDSFLTPNEYFYVRNHFPVPVIDDINDYKLHIHYQNNNTNFNFDYVNNNFDDLNGDIMYTYNDIKKKFKGYNIISTLQCSGNRGDQLRSVNSNIIGQACMNGFISNASWNGVLLYDLLYDSIPNLDEIIKDNNYKYLTFYGLDSDMSNMHYSMSVPIEHILNRNNQVLLAYEMNDETLPRDHGYPIRLLIPGVAGCRSVKWLTKILFTENEVDNQWQNYFYQPYKNKIFDMPVNSVISRPYNGQTIELSKMRQ